MRPGYLFGAIFVWLAWTGGRFTAPFLEEVAQFDESMIGLAFGLQILFATLFAGIGSKTADELELYYPGKGRVYLLMALLFVGNIGFNVHYLVYHYNITHQGQLSTNMAAMFHIIGRIILASCWGILQPIVDGISLAYLKEINANEAQYGKERLFGAVSWAIANFIIGPVLDKYGYLMTFFWTSWISTILCIVVIYCYMLNKSQPSTTTCDVGVEKLASDDRASEDSEDTDETVGSNSNPDAEFEAIDANTGNLDDEPWNSPSGAGSESIQILKSMFLTCAGAGFIVSTITLNMGTSIVENLIFLYFQELGASNTICGFSIVVTVLFEIPIFQYSSQLLGMFGAEALQKIACVAYVFRVVGYTFIPKDHVALVLLFEPLHGVTYACAKTSSVEFASKLSPPGFESTGQGIMSSFQGMGVIIGLSMGGWIEKTFSSVILYRSYAIIVYLGLIVFYMTSYIDASWRKEVSSYSRISKEQVSYGSV